MACIGMACIGMACGKGGARGWPGWIGNREEKHEEKHEGKHGNENINFFYQIMK